MYFDCLLFAAFNISNDIIMLLLFCLIQLNEISNNSKNNNCNLLAPLCAPHENIIQCVLNKNWLLHPQIKEHDTFTHSYIVKQRELVFITTHTNRGLLLHDSRLQSLYY